MSAPAVATGPRTAEELAVLLRAARESARLTLDDVETLTGKAMSRSRLSRLENGQRLGYPLAVLRVLQLYGFDLVRRRASVAGASRRKRAASMASEVSGSELAG